MSFLTVAATKKVAGTVARSGLGFSQPAGSDFRFRLSAFSSQNFGFVFWPWWPSARTQSTMLEPGMDQSL
jgi:hypothetical protein